MSLNNPDDAGAIQVVGNSFTEGSQVLQRPYRIAPTHWDVNSNGTFNITNLGLEPLEWEATANDINDVGEIIINTNQSRDIGDNGYPLLPAWYLSTPGEVRQQLTMQSNYAEAFAINNSGEIAGTDHHTYVAGSYWNDPAVKSDLGLFRPSDIDDSGVMAGYVSSTFGNDGGPPAIARLNEGGELEIQYLTEPSGLFDERQSGIATSISQNGDFVAGHLDETDGTKQAFLWSDDTGIVSLGTLGGASSSALGVNNYGQVVGWSDTGGGKSLRTAFLWENGEMFDLNAISQGGGGSQLLEAAAINNSGHIVGYMNVKSNGGSEEHAYVLLPRATASQFNTAVPEPATLAILWPIVIFGVSLWWSRKSSADRLTQ